MPTSSDLLVKKLTKKGYTRCAASKVNGRWTACATDPLKNTQLKFENLGQSVESAINALAQVSAVPSHHLSGYSNTCSGCGVIDRPMVYTSSESGDVLFRCQSCGNEWVASTAAEEILAAEARMEEASEVLHPVLRRFVR